MQEMLEAVEKDMPEAGTPLAPSRRAASVAATAVTYWAAARVGRAVVSFSRREGVAVWALVVGAAAYVFLSTVFVFFVYARKCFSKPRRRIDGGGGGGGVKEAGGGGGGELVRDGAVANGGEGTTELSALLGGGDGGSREAGQRKDR